jgi:hypothetical protein
VFAYAELDEILRGAGRTDAIGMSASRAGARTRCRRGSVGAWAGRVTDVFAYAELDEILRGAGRTDAIGMSASRARARARATGLRRPISPTS